MDSALKLKYPPVAQKKSGAIADFFKLSIPDAVFISEEFVRPPTRA
jgi:hypothetical protein